MPVQDEVAELSVGGSTLSNWKTVNVSVRWGELYSRFHFSTAEPFPMPPSYLNQHPNIGDMVEIKLAGILVLSGPVTLRESMSDKNNHAIMVVGKSLTWQMVKSSADTKTGNYDGWNIEEIAKDLAKQTNVNVKVIEKIDRTPFQRLQHITGEPATDFLEHIARSRACIVGSEPNGDLLLIGLHKDIDEGDALVEGENILRINVIWDNDHIYESVTAVGQRFGDDEKAGKEVSQLTATEGDGKDPLKSKLVVPEEHPDDQEKVDQRAKFEMRWHNGTMLRVIITVQGWLRKNGDIWRVGNLYWVTAPSHLLNGWGLKAQNVTFCQSDNEGTTTVLELVLPWFLNGMLTQDNVPEAPVSYINMIKGMQ